MGESRVPIREQLTHQRNRPYKSGQPRNSLRSALWHASCTLQERKGVKTMLRCINSTAAQLVGSAILIAGLLLPAAAFAQDRDRYDHGPDHFTRIEPGTTLAVRLNDNIDVTHGDNRVYMGRVDHDVRGDNGRLAIPRDSPVELMVRTNRDNQLVLDVDSVTVNGQRFAVRANADHIESRNENGLVGSILGAIEGQQVRGSAVRVQRGTVLSFRIDRPLEMNVPDRGYDRDGYHYHGGQ